MILVRIHAEFVLVLATQTLTSRKPCTGVRARGYAEPIILRSPAPLGRAAARTARLLAAVRHLCGGISKERLCVTRDRQRGRVRGTYNRRYAINPRVARQPTTTPTTIGGWRMKIFLSRERHRTEPARLHDA